MGGNGTLANSGSGWIGAYNMYVRITIMVGEGGLEMQAWTSSMQLPRCNPKSGHPPPGEEYYVNDLLVIIGASPETGSHYKVHGGYESAPGVLMVDRFEPVE
jgi:hypothetical protein